MRPPFLDADVLSGLISIEDVIAVERQAFAQKSRGVFIAPPRMAMPVASGTLDLMPAWRRGAPVFGAKLLTVIPGETSRRVPASRGIVAMFSAADGHTVAILDAAWVTGVRTGATAGLSADLLARPGANRLAVLGSGPIASWSARAVRAVRALTSTTIWSRSIDHAEDLVTELVLDHGFDALTTRVANTAADAVAEADIVVTATRSPEPLIRAEDLARGTHVSAMGADFPARELDGETMSSAHIVVDSLEMCWEEAGELIIAEREGWLRRTDVVDELGAVVLDPSRGRQSESEVTVFKSTGVAFQDIALAEEILERRLPEAVSAE